jgi:hypothetical protein
MFSICVLASMALSWGLGLDGPPTPRGPPALSRWTMVDAPPPGRCNPSALEEDYFKKARRSKVESSWMSDHGSTIMPEGRSLPRIMSDLGPTIRNPCLLWFDEGEQASALVAAVIVEDLQAITALVTLHGHDLNEVGGKYLITAAYVAALLGKDDALLLLAGLGADLERADLNGASPALCSSETGNAGCLSILIKAGVDPDKGDGYNRTPAFWAARYGHKECLRILLDCKVDAQCPCGHWGSPLRVAERKGHKECVEMIRACVIDCEAAELLDKPAGAEVLRQSF